MVSRKCPLLIFLPCQFYFYKINQIDETIGAIPLREFLSHKDGIRIALIFMMNIAHEYQHRLNRRLSSWNGQFWPSGSLQHYLESSPFILFGESPAEYQIKWEKKEGNQCFPTHSSHGLVKDLSHSFVMTAVGMIMKRYFREYEDYKIEPQRTVIPWRLPWGNL